MLEKKIPRMKADIVLLQETKCDDINIRWITQRIWLGCEDKWIATKGASGGISTLWDPKIIDMEDISSIPKLLTLKFKSRGSEEEDYITNTYGPNMPNLKRNFLDEITLLGASLNNQVWILGGDFNIITNPLEKLEGLYRIDQQSKDFGELIEKLILVNIPNRNDIFTWNNKRGKEPKVVICLDRFLL
jgi:exonuclease III